MSRDSIVNGDWLPATALSAVFSTGVGHRRKFREFSCTECIRPWEMTLN